MDKRVGRGSGEGGVALHAAKPWVMLEWLGREMIANNCLFWITESWMTRASWHGALCDYLSVWLNWSSIDANNPHRMLWPDENKILRRWWAAVHHFIMQLYLVVLSLMLELGIVQMICHGHCERISLNGIRDSWLHTGPNIGAPFLFREKQN